MNFSLTAKRMFRRRVMLAFIILGICAACQPTFVPEDPLPTRAELPPPIQPTARPTQTPRVITLPTASDTPLRLPTPTRFPGDVVMSNNSGVPSPVPSRIVISTRAAIALSPPPLPSTAIIIPTLPTATPGTPGTPTATIVPTVAAGSNSFSLGTSVEGRGIWAWRFGTGEKVLLLVGGVHTGFEANTVQLVNEFIGHFESTPADVLPGITLILVPVLNPDGLAVGRRTDGRFNANGIDLNRNWGCEWSADARWKDELVNPGPRAFSEPETLALAQWIRSERPAAAIFYHSAANGIFAGNCEGSHTSDGLAAVLGEATGYPYGKPFTAYPVSGTESNWADGLGIPSVDVELAGTRDSEFTRNLKGVLAVECWLAGGGSPLPDAICQ